MLSSYYMIEIIIGIIRSKPQISPELEMSYRKLVIIAYNSLIYNLIPAKVKKLCVAQINIRFYVDTY